VEYVKDLNLGEVWANYTYSYVNVAMADAHRNEFTMWPSNYMLREPTHEDIEVSEDNMEAMYTAKNLYRGLVKYYA
jgi:hypothetical protein